MEAVQLLWDDLLAIVALFFFFRDGEALVTYMNQLLPMRADVKARIEERVRQLVVGATRGAILTSLAQGVAATLGFLILGTPYAFLLGSLTMLVSVIPFISTSTRSRGITKGHKE